MKCIIGIDRGSYSFTPGNPNVGTVQIFGLPSFTLKQINIIVNVTDGVIIYNFADSMTGTLLDNIITLASDTSTMSSTDELKIILDLPDDVLKSPVTNYNYVSIDENTPFDSIPFFGDQIQSVLGSKYLIGITGGLKTENYFSDIVYTKTVGGLNGQAYKDFSGIGTAVIQVSGTFVGTLTWEVTANGGDFVGILGYPPNTLIPVLTTTANGIWKLNVTGFVGLRVRMSAWTSGVATIRINLSSSATSPNAPNTIFAQGSQTQNLVQRASTYELNTYDTNLATVLGSALVVNPQAQVIPIAPVAPTANAGAVGNMFKNSPQIYPRLRVESAGSERLPFAQEPNSNKIKTVSETEETLLKQILTALKVQNCFLYQWLDYNGFPNLRIPDGYEDILTNIKGQGD